MDEAELQEYPFHRSGTVGPEYFWDRVDERRSFERLIAAGEVGFVEGPRRTGKTSLALLASDELRKRHDWRIGYINLRTVTSATLADRLVTTVASLAHTNPVAQAAERVQRLIGSFRIRPEVVAGFDDMGMPQGTVRFQQFRKEDEVSIFEDILNLLWDAPTHAKTRVALVIDEFQEVMSLAPILPELIKASFQSGRKVALVMMGSRQSLMDEIAHSPQAALYRIGPSIPVGPLPRATVHEEVIKRFGWADISVDANLANRIYDACDGIAQDVQTVCAILLDRAKEEGWRTIEERHLELAMDDVLREVSARFVDVWLDLSPIQQELLTAIAQYGGESITSEAFLDRLNPHRRRSSPAVLKAARALKDRDILATGERGYRFQDPFFALYLRRVVANPTPDLSLIS